MITIYVYRDEEKMTQQRQSIHHKLIKQSIAYSASNQSTQDKIPLLNQSIN